MTRTAGNAGDGTGWGDPAGLSEEGLAAALAGASAVEAASKARFLALLGEFMDRQIWESEGCVSAVQWLSWRCGLGSVAASEHIRVAQALRCLPALAASLASGAITWSKVRAVTRIATAATETTWLDVALDGSLVITLRVPAAEGAAVISAIQEHTTSEAGVPIAARRADAMVELLLGPDIATPTVTIVTTADALTTVAGDGDPGPCATDTGIAIDPGTAAAAACDGPVVASDADGVNRQQRYPTAATRRLLARRDPTCRFPGCHHTGRREAHHLIHWIHGGSRQPDNLVLLCPGHHWIATCLAQSTTGG